MNAEKVALLCKSGKSNSVLINDFSFLFYWWKYFVYCWSLQFARNIFSKLLVRHDETAKLIENIFHQPVSFELFLNSLLVITKVLKRLLVITRWWIKLKGNGAKWVGWRDLCKWGMFTQAQRLMNLNENRILHSKGN